MMRFWDFVLVVFSVNLIITNGEEEIQKVMAELRNQTSENSYKETNKFEKILENVEAVMDPTVDPCRNFYRFVCGKYSQESLHSFKYAFEETKKLIVSKYEQEEPLESAAKSSLIKHSRNLYFSCMNSKTQEALDDFLLRDLEAIGGWPVLKGKSWNKTAFNWKNIIFKTGNEVTSNNYLFQLSHSIIDNDISLTISPLIYNDESAMKTALRFGANETIAKKELKKIDMFLKKYSNQLQRSDKSKKFALHDLIRTYPYVSWLNHLSYLVPNIQLNYTLEVSGYEAIKDLHDLINRTNQKVLANFVAWKRFETLNDFLTLYINTPKSQNNERCFSLVAHRFPMGPGALYIREFINQTNWKEVKKSAEIISNNIREQNLEMLRRANWLNNKTYLLEKIQQINYQFGYPSELLNDTLLNNYYDVLETNKTNFFETILSIYSFDHNNLLKNPKPSIFNDIEALHFGNLTSLPSADYRINSNSIRVTFILLSKYFLDVNRPMWMNYAAFGVIMGHEFGHSLDPRFIQLNAKGENISWALDSTSYAEYDNKVRCLNEQYKDIANISSELREEFKDKQLYTTRDDVADNLGFKAAYLAYKSLSVEENSQTLHQKEYSPNQLFWIYATNRWCSDIEPLRERFERNMLTYQDNHSSFEMRILGSLSNIEEFSRDFNCPQNSSMNYQPKCNLF